MITSPTARWLFTVVFAVAALGAVLPRRARARAADGCGMTGAGDTAGQVPARFCLVMCGSLIAMTWWSEPSAAAVVQAALFGCAALGFGFAAVASPGPRGRHSLANSPQMLMAVAMIWMLTALSGATMPAAPGMPDGTPAPVLVVSIGLAVCCAATGCWWLARAVGPRTWVKDPAWAGHAVMSVGMAAMLLATL